MLLEFDLIEQSTQYSADNLKNIEKTDCPYLFFLKSFINPTLLDKLLNYISTEELCWLPETNQEYQNRLKLNWVFNTVVEEMHIVLENLTIALNQKFNRNNKFIGLTIWKDQEGYTISKHNKDNPIIDLAIQIYLTDDAVNLGTKFEYNNKIFSTKYQKNHGYLYDNSQGVTHYMTTPVPKNHVRYSLYAMWSKLN
jgi:hypothetical protein